ncbi:hypothetical protein [Kaistia adipata]|uniref:hypothetical protein n=1 Tax=Kaistia adipata TaxID=166954 RepID=UPI0004018DCC|nr:hypothetical protein [Kaistia adipata]
MLWDQRRTGGRHSIGAVIKTLILVPILLLPFWLAVSAVASNTDEIGDMIRTVPSLRLPAPPA